MRWLGERVLFQREGKTSPTILTNKTNQLGDTSKATAEIVSREPKIPDPMIEYW